jgi:hypothetical protein
MNNIIVSLDPPFSAAVDSLIRLHWREGHPIVILADEAPDKTPYDQIIACPDKIQGAQKYGFTPDNVEFVLDTNAMAWREKGFTCFQVTEEK